MLTEHSKILDECLARVRSGETIESCLASYPEISEQLRPLLETAANISVVPKVAPSEDFRRLSPERLMARIREESKPKMEKSYVEKGSNLWQGLWRGLAARPLLATFLVILLIGGLCATALRGVISPTDSVQAAEYTVSVLSGDAEVKTSDSSEWQPVTSGLKYMEGTVIRTEDGSQVVLTFVDGSTTKLEPNTEITVIKSEYKDNGSVTINLAQQLGKTWNYLQKAGKKALNFEIQTPSATLAAHGTAFISEVDADGLTTVEVFDGTVDVKAQEQEVKLTANLQTEVEPGMTPASPAPVLRAKGEMVVVTDLPTVASVLDPGGSSTGILPSGISFNQIVKSTSMLSTDKQRIEVDDPAGGEYSIIVRNVSQDAAKINIQLRQDGQMADSVVRIPAGSGESDWIIRIKISKGVDNKISSKVVSVEPLKDNTTETIVETELAKERATPVAVSITSQSPTRTASPVTPGVGYNTLTPQIKTPHPTATSATDDNTGTVVTLTPTPAPTLVPEKTPLPTTTSTTDDNSDNVATPTPTPAPTLVPEKTPLPTTTGTTDDNTGNVATPTPTPAPTLSPVKTPVPTATSTTDDNTGTIATPAPTLAPVTTLSPPDTGSLDDNSGDSGTSQTGNTGLTGTNK